MEITIRSGDTLKAKLSGLFANPNACAGRLRLSFPGQNYWTGSASAHFALRFQHPLPFGICHWLASGHWPFLIGDEIPTRIDGISRSLADIVTDVNQILEPPLRLNRRMGVGSITDGKPRLQMCR